MGSVGATPKERGKKGTETEKGKDGGGPEVVPGELKEEKMREKREKDARFWPA